MPCETCPKEGCETRSPGLSHVCNLEFWEIQVFEPPHAGSDTFGVGATCHFKGTQPQNSGVNSNTELPLILHRKSEPRPRFGVVVIHQLSLPETSHLDKANRGKSMRSNA